MRPLQPLPLQPLGEYERPALPTDRRVRRWWKRLRERFTRDEADPYLPPEQLERATLDSLEGLSAPPACGPLLRELSLALDPWIADASSAQRTRLVVLPPCDGNDLMVSWAKREGLECLPAPPRAALIDRFDDDVPQALEARGGANRTSPPLVVPRLEEWFLRHAGGLDLVRGLLAAIDRTERRVIVGCNSWAWSYLSKAVDADMVLPEPLTFHAFDADRLHGWLEELADEGTRYTFRTAATGADIFARAEPKADGERGAIHDDFLRTLSAQSLGIPWVAWHMWRLSLRSVPEAEEASEELDEICADDEDTVFLGQPEDVVLPERHERKALLILHSLLIHGPLTRDELLLVLPEIGSANMIAALLHAGVLARDDGDRLRCREAAYPTVREGLAALGFSMDRL